MLSVDLIAAPDPISPSFCSLVVMGRPPRSIRATVLLTLCLAAVMVAGSIAVRPAAGQGTLYWTSAEEPSAIYRACADGSNAEVVIGAGGLPISFFTMTFDPENQAVYGTDVDGSIRRFNVDGTGLETLGNAGVPANMVIDIAGGWMYWADHNAEEIRRANLDGTGAETVVTTARSPWPPMLDLQKDYIYWVDVDGIHRVSLDGSEAEFVAEYRTNTSNCLEFDPANGWFYWVQENEGYRIVRVRTDGSEFEALPVDGARCVRVDPDRDQIFWNHRTNGTILRANADGSEQEIIITVDDSGETNQQIDIFEIDPAGQTIFWSSFQGFSGLHRATFEGESLPALHPDWGVFFPVISGELGRIFTLLDGDLVVMDLDGENVATLFSAELGAQAPMGVAVDDASGRIYWTEMGGRIRSSAVDGSAIRTEVDGLIDPTSLAVDPVGGMTYWHSSSTSTLERAHLDGTGREVVPIDFVDAFWIDAPGRQLYWAAGEGSIHRANLDGSEEETLVDNAGSSTALVADPETGVVFWGSGTSISRANFDGTGLETIITDLPRVVDMEIDAEGGWIYWSTFTTIERARLDGSKVEVVAVGEREHSALAGLFFVPGNPVSVDPSSKPHRVTLNVYPNPSNGHTTIGFVIDASGDVQMELFDILGRRVARLHDGMITAGEHRLAYDASALAPGLYILRAVLPNGESTTRQLTVVR